ncbi:nucleotidyltransferase family protein [Desulfomonile tiedjei]|uniref:Nucleotidyltransferase family protein n=1 Tax=Desulfomonile tiedjei (strain ATCC 49306 / DSM 6799 / DCB-1) TaxID=706587 RepID=I4CCM1_DESTA|nr:nucleotidyltransferase family protein [Desulfomonile tiedjei]AFM27312.1 hypothetical protein Desti_4691 [Desulfomonile tiedjei DSM 6799]
MIQNPVDIQEQVRLLCRESVFDRVPSEDWCAHWDERHLRSIRLHGLAPWLYAFLHTRPELGFSEPFLDALRKDYHQSCLENLIHESCMRRIAEACSQQDVPLVLLKGAYLGTFVYKNPAIRPMCDVDVMVLRKDLAVVQEILKTLGYVLMIDVPESFKPHLYPSRPYMRPGIRPEVVDLHSELRLLDYYRLPESDVWAHSYDTEIFGCKIRFLSPELNTINVAIHALSSATRFRDYLDLMLMLERLQTDWNEILSLCENLGVVYPVGIMMQELASAWGAQVPAAVLKSFAAYRPSAMEKRIAQNRFRYVWRIVARILQEPDWASKLHFVKLRLFPSAEYRMAVLRTSDPLEYVKSKWLSFRNLFTNKR